MAITIEMAGKAEVLLFLSAIGADWYYQNSVHLFLSISYLYPSVPLSLDHCNPQMI